MRKVADYRKHAEKCRELAKSMTEPDNKEILQTLARSWDRLATIRERDLQPEQDA